MEKPNVNLVFIDARNYNQLLDKSFTINDVPTLLQKPHEGVSQLTQASVIYLNEKLSTILFGAYHCPIVGYLGHYGTAFDAKYIADHFALTVGRDTDASCSTGEKYYELKPLANNDLLVVVSDGFLPSIAESKSNLLQFVLDCLRYTYTFKYSCYSLTKLYIDLKMNSNQMDMLKLRF